MDGYSGLGPSGIPPTAERVWAVQKKDKTGDHRRRENKKKDFGGDEKREEELRDVQGAEENGNQGEPVSSEEEEEFGYGTAKSPVKKSRKIDLVI